MSATRDTTQVGIEAPHNLDVIKDTSTKTVWSCQGCARSDACTYRETWHKQP